MSDVDPCPRAASHDWEPVDVQIAGRGAFETCVVLRCSECGDLCLDYEAEVVGEVRP